MNDIKSVAPAVADPAEKAVGLVGEKLTEDFLRVARNEPHATVAEVALLMASAYSTGRADTLSARSGAGEGDPNAKKRIAGDCGWCDAVAEMVAALDDTFVCAACHANPGIPTVSLAALADETPVYVITRGDLAEMAWRDVTDVEAAQILRYAENSGRAHEAISDAVSAVCGSHPAFAEEDE